MYKGEPMTPLCWFCNHPGERWLRAQEVSKIDLGKVCEAHIDFQVLYAPMVGASPMLLTPRIVIESENEFRKNCLLSAWFPEKKGVTDVPNL